MAFSKIFSSKQETKDEEKSIKKEQLQLGTSNILADIEQSVVQILEYTQELQNKTVSHKSKIVVTEKCDAINHFCQCIERALLFGFKKKLFRAPLQLLWSFIAEATQKCFPDSAQLESDVALIKSINALNDIGRVRAFLRQSFRSKSIPKYFELISEQTEIIQANYSDFGILHKKERINALLAHLRKLNALSAKIEFQMLLNDATLNDKAYFKFDAHSVPQWIVPRTIKLKKKSKKKQKKHKSKRKKDESNEGSHKPHKHNKKKHKHKKHKSERKKRKQRKDSQKMNSKSVSPPLLTVNDGSLSKQRSNSVGTNTAQMPILSLKNENSLNFESKSIHSKISENLNTDLQSELEKVRMERNEFEQQMIAQKNEILRLQSKLDKRGQTDLSEEYALNSFGFDCKESEIKWKNALQMNDKIDYKWNNVWIRAMVVGYDKNNENRLKVRFDGWNCEHFEDRIVINRYNDCNLAQYKTKTGISNYQRNREVKDNVCFENNNILWQGFMEKEGGTWKTWKRRYFRLDFQGNMRYYHQKGDKEFINEFNILNANTKIETNKECFCVTTPDRIWRFCCKSTKEAIKWVNAINFVKEF